MTKEELKIQAIEYEKQFKFKEALEIYAQCEDVLEITDGSIIRYATLLYEFQEYLKAKEIFERIILKYRYVTKEILRLLADIYEHLGDNESALKIYEKLGEKKKVAQLKNEKDLINPKEQYISKFIELFSGREDTFSIQTENGYYPVRRALTEIDVAQHFSGKRTIGIYVLRSDDTVKFGAYDVDVKKGSVNQEELINIECKKVAKSLYDALKSEQIKSYVEFSGNKGYHIWIFLDAPIPAYKMKYILEKISSKVKTPENINIEIFPKQTNLNGGLGNLIKAPLGIHQKTKKRCTFLDENFEPIDDQLSFLLNIEKNQSERIEKLYRELFNDMEVDISEKNTNTKIPKESSSRKEPQTIDQTTQIKKELRQQIKSQQSQEEFLAKSCSIIAQILQKIEKFAYITDFEEKILISTFKHLQNGQEILERLLSRTINYSKSTLQNKIQNIGAIPITCEEIKKESLATNLPLDLSKCVCRFSEPLNTPLNYLSASVYITDLNLEDVAKRIIELTREKAEIENQIETLKEILKRKTDGEIKTSIGTVRKSEKGEIEIII